MFHYSADPSCRFSIVMIEQSAQACVSAKSSSRAFWNPINQLISQALMGALEVIVLYVLVYRPAQMPLTPSCSIIQPTHHAASR